MAIPRIPRFSLAALAGLSFMSPVFAVVSIDYVLVDNVGNGADPATGSVYGAVAYKYTISRNETTIAQYTEFLNAVAKTDTYGLYNTNMGTDAWISGISRSGVDGSYTYSVIGSGDRPVTYVSWFDAARFTNWLHHGQPIGAQGTGTTEDGAYDLLGAVSGTGVVRNPDAKVWIPSENEWYKAAYYDPTKNAGTGGYWLHANRSDSMTSNNFATPGAANYNDGNYAKDENGLPTYLSGVGAYGFDSQSYYGTNDQAGNVWEWNEAVIDPVTRGLRGGSWADTSGALASTFVLDYTAFPATVENAFIGFRVAAVPEPGTLLLTLIFGGGLLARRHRRR